MYRWQAATMTSQRRQVSPTLICSSKSNESTLCIHAPRTELHYHNYLSLKNYRSPAPFPSPSPQWFLDPLVLFAFGSHIFTVYQLWIAKKLKNNPSCRILAGQTLGIFLLMGFSLGWMMTALSIDTETVFHNYIAEYLTVVTATALLGSSGQIPTAW